MSVCLVLCVCRGSKYSEVVPDWLILNSDLYRTIHDCGPLRTQFDDVVVLAVVFFALLSPQRSTIVYGSVQVRIQNQPIRNDLRIFRSSANT